MGWSYWTNADYRDAIDQGKRYEDLVTGLNLYISSIENMLEDVESVYALDDKILDSNNDNAQGKYYIIYESMCNRHKYRKNTIREHFDSSLEQLRERRNYFEERQAECLQRAYEIEQEENQEDEE